MKKLIIALMLAVVVLTGCKEKEEEKPIEGGEVAPVKEEVTYKITKKEFDGTQTVVVFSATNNTTKDIEVTDFKVIFKYDIEDVVLTANYNDKLVPNVTQEVSIYYPEDLTTAKDIVVEISR